METKMPPQEPPKQITSMGSVFGTPMTGFALVNQGVATPPTAERTAAIMPTDVLTQDVMTLKVEVKELKNQILEMKEAISKIVASSSLPPQEPLAATSGVTLLTTTQAREILLKKKPGRPKKVA